ncbi:hypothetical protein [Cognaticolwellia mytili]|uniref:hypothetical protein n=1 Tax=Cognaticolwellia mytili TaxID=1888913 RepID=UPI001B8013A0|nr:hypothetical protein [Cognaticolwellia mytili]
MDTSVLENTAESKIAHELQKNGLLVAKPYFDQNGTDLLAFMNMSDGVKFCRIQSKGRSVPKGKSNNIHIPQNYVSHGFIVFLYLDFGDSTDELYMFLSSDLETWKINKKNEYVLSLTNSNVRSKLEKYVFNSSKVTLIKTIIENAETNGEFNKLIYAQITETFSSFTESCSVVVDSNT